MGILSREDANRYRAMCSWRRSRNQPVPTEAEYKAYRNSEDAGKHKSIGIHKDKGTEANRIRYERSLAQSRNAKKRRRRKEKELAESAEPAGVFTERKSVIIARINARAKAMITPKAQSVSWSA